VAKLPSRRRFRTDLDGPRKHCARRVALALDEDLLAGRQLRSLRLLGPALSGIGGERDWHANGGLPAHLSGQGPSQAFSQGAVGPCLLAPRPQEVGRSLAKSP